MSRLPLFDAVEVRRAIVVVKAMWRMHGDEPLTVMMAQTPETTEWAWRREAQRFMQLMQECTQQQTPFTSDLFFDNQPQSEEWDNMVGEVPGIDDPILSKEIKWGRKFYQTGEVKVTDVVLKKPVLS